MRARNLKPSIFRNELLAVADPIYTVIFEGLWCLADREGRTEDRPAKIHFEVNPGRAFETTERSLAWLHEHGFIERYSVGERRYIQVVKFAQHQNPHHKEPPSIIPKPGAGLGHSRQHVEPKALGKPGATRAKKRHAKSSLGTKTVLIPDSGFLTPDSGSLIPESEEASASSARAAGNDVESPPSPTPTPTKEAMARTLAELGVQVTSSHPVLGDWVKDGYTIEDTTKATALARARKPWPDPIPASYVDRILRDPKAARRAGNANGVHGGKSIDALIDEACER